jgi:hypothetical protein
MTAMTATLGRFWSRLWGEPPAEGPDALPVRVHGTEFTPPVQRLCASKGLTNRWHG